MSAIPNDTWFTWGEMKRRIDLSYLAGIFDAEGEYGMESSGKGRARRLVMGLKKSHRPTIRLLHKTLGGHVTAVPPAKDGYKPQWRWRVHGAAATRAYHTLKPHLRIKRDVP